jgi:hypothetical protein
MNLQQTEIDTPAVILAKRLLRYMRAKGYEIFTAPGELNIVYVEGMDVDGTQNVDAPDAWNDLRCVIDFVGDTPRLLHCAVATTEPGRAGTMSADAAKRGGVARIAFGQYTAWRAGFHNTRKNGKNHPALVHVMPLPVHRDKNRDMKRPGDKIHIGYFGINQHSTRPGYFGGNVGTWSEGCLVGLLWDQHLEFMRLCKTDPRYLADPNFIFTSAVLPGNEIAE